MSLAGSLPSIAFASRTTAVVTPLDPAKLDSWLKVGGDGTITAYTSKVELGQGNQTALTQIIAEELDLPISSINLVMGDTGHGVQEFGTDGSRTIADAGANLR